MGTDKNIKLHIVTDIKGNMYTMALNLMRIGKIHLPRSWCISTQQVRHVSKLTQDGISTASKPQKHGIFTKYREPPQGFLFGEKPRKPGEKREWEGITYFTIFNCFLITGFFYFFAPSENSIDWARKEAFIRIAEIEAEEAAAAAETNADTIEAADL